MISLLRTPTLVVAARIMTVPASLMHLEPWNDLRPSTGVGFTVEVSRFRI